MGNNGNNTGTASGGESYPPFRCVRCGACCRWPGPVRVDDAEIAAIARFLQMPENDFLELHTRLAPDRKGLSLLEKQDGSCEFLSDDNLCIINPVKPMQCRNYPEHWETAPEFRASCKGRLASRD